MTEPPSRSTMWEHGFPDSPADYDWRESFCGGKLHQWSPSIGGKCGICGDPWDGEREHEAPGGKYANGIITRTYEPGQEIMVTSEITANHLGFVEVRLCRNNDVTQDPDQTCFDQPGAALTFVETGEDKLWITDAMGGSPTVQAMVRLPAWECDQCILQWTYRNGRDADTCNGACGPVETFRACADISILGSGVAHNTTHHLPSTSTESGPEETTTPLPTLPPHTTCHATGAWTGDTKQDAWCNENCLHDPPYCPEDVCTCSQDYKQQTTHTCRATGVWEGNQELTAWCQNSCKASPAFCPASICNCEHQ